MGVSPLVLFFALWLPSAGMRAADIDSSLLRSADTLRFEIILGRVSASAARYRHTRSQSQKDERTAANESLSVHVQAGLPTLHYDYQDQAKRLTIDVVDGSEFDMRLTRLADDPVAPVHFMQPREGPLRLSVQTPEGTRAYTAATLWHLMVAHPRVCREHLLPLLELLRSDWQLDGKLAQVEQALLDVARAGVYLDQPYVEQLVEQLRSNEYVARQQAVCELQECGFRVLPLLDMIDVRTLDAEQRLRVQQIRKRLSVTTGDTPDRVANWLSSDRGIWLALLLEGDRERCDLSREQLARLCNRPISFEYLASDAERARQVARLRTRLDIK